MNCPSPPSRVCGLYTLTLALCLLVATDGRAQAVSLELLAALPIEGLGNAQPSGLALADGELFAVSDQHDHAVCRLELLEDRAVMDPYVTFNAPWSGAWVRGLDFEGLAYRDGSFFLLSEATFRVLRVHETGGELAWVTPSVEEAGLEAGLFNDRKALLVGLALLGGGRVVLAAERAPRGLIDVLVDPQAKEVSIQPYELGGTSLELPAPRDPDFADLFFDGLSLYALTRNADAVVRIDYDAGPSDGVLAFAGGTSGFSVDEDEAWLFAHVTNDPAYRYDDMTFGTAGGLCMDDERVYIVLDNNGHARETDPTDTRPLLFVFARPQ